MTPFFSPRRAVLALSFASGALFGVGTTLGATLLGSDVFVDVPRNAYYDEAVGELYSDGVIKGMDATHFAPDSYVTRGQVAVMLQRLKNELTGNVRSSSSRSRSSTASSSSESSSSSSVSSSSSSVASRNPRGLFRFTTTAFSVNENIANATISVVRTGGAEGNASVTYAATAGSATADTDFTPSTATLSFASGETSKTFTIQIKDDTASEGNETINLALSSPTNGSDLTTPNTATLTIADNEAPTSSASSVSSASSSTNPAGTLSLSASAFAVSEKGGSLTVTVNRAGGSTGTVGVTYATSNNSATSGTDYSGVTGTLSFGPGETTKTFVISIANNESITGNKAFNITLSAVTGGASLSTASAVATIYDDESTTFGSGSLKLSKSAYNALEGDKKIDVTVLRTGGAHGTVTVRYSTINGTAYSGADYTLTSGTLTFAPGEASKIVSIPLVDDSASEGEDTFILELSEPTAPATLLSPSSATITIFD